MQGTFLDNALHRKKNKASIRIVQDIGKYKVKHELFYMCVSMVSITCNCNWKSKLLKTENSYL